MAIWMSVLQDHFSQNKLLGFFVFWGFFFSFSRQQLKVFVANGKI